MKRLLPFILAGALSAVAVVPAAASNHTVNDCEITIPQDGGGAAALAALIAAAVDADVAVAVCNVSVELLNNSLNNLLRNANIEVLNNSLNNLLRNADIDVNVLNASTIEVSVLGGNDFTIVFV